jgi:hypothetical protein
VQGASGGKKTNPPPPTTHEQGPPISSQTAHKLKSTGKDHRLLSHFARSRGRRSLESPIAAGTSTPSALGSAFDLGSGPLALLAVLAGTALLFLGGSGLRVWRARHHG